MLHVQDNITLGLLGIIAAGKTTLTEAAQNPEFTHNLLDPLLLGNFWVPPTVSISPEGVNQRLLDRYGEDPQGVAFEFQVAQFANRFRRHKDVEGNSGVNIVDMPIAADRWGYAVANRENMGSSFESYVEMFDDVSPNAKEPDAYVYLRVPRERIDVVLDRIRARKRPAEQGFLQDPSYLLRLIDVYDEFHTHVTRPVITVDATGFTPRERGGLDREYLSRTLDQIAVEARRYCRPPRLTIDMWEAVDFNTAQKAARTAKRQLRGYLRQNQRILTIAGLVAAGKTGFGETLSDDLDIELVRELQGRNDTVSDELVSKFLRDKQRYCFELQKYLTPKRSEARRKAWATGKSFVEDRTPEEDQIIFHRRFREQGYLTDEQFRELRILAISTYSAAPKSHCMILLEGDPKTSRRRALLRGRAEEVNAWPEEELQELRKLYEDFFDRVDELLAHDGSRVTIDTAKVDIDKEIHRGYVFQQILLGMLDEDERKRQRTV